MNSKINDKETLKNQLEAVWKTTGRKPPELDPPCELSEIFYEPWSFFLRLHSKRSSSGFGPNSLSFTEIKSFFDLIDYKPDAWELDMIERFDDVAMKVISEQQAKKQKEKPKS